MHHLFMQVITLPTNISDLAAWLLIPAVMGIIAPFLVNVFLSLDPAKLTPFKGAATLAAYILIALVSVGLTTIPADVLAQFQPIFVAIMAAIAAYIGDKALRGAGLLVGLVMMRFAFGPTNAHVYFQTHQ